MCCNVDYTVYTLKYTVHIPSLGVIQLYDIRYTLLYSVHNTNCTCTNLPRCIKGNILHPSTQYHAFRFYAIEYVSLYNVQCTQYQLYLDVIRFNMYPCSGYTISTVPRIGVIRLNMYSVHNTSCT